MDEGTPNIREDLKFVLEQLTDIMCFPQWSVGRHHNIHFNEILRSALYIQGIGVSQTIHRFTQVSIKSDTKAKRPHMIGFHGINLFNFRAERDRLIRDKLNEITRSTFTREEFELKVNCPDPSGDHT